MAAYGKCVCGKNVSEKKDGTPRAHTCNADGGPAWAASVQPVVPADVDEANAFLSGGPEPKPVKGPWFDATYDSTLDCGHWVNQGEAIRADGEGGWECREWCEDADTPSELDYTDGSAPSENWNGTGRPRPSASNVKLPEPEPQADKPRLLDALRNANPDQMTAQQRAAAGLLGLAGQAVSAALGAEQMARAFSGTAMEGSRADVNAFLSPSQSGIGSGDANDFLAAPEPQALGSATGQPETERDRYGRYLVKDPRTGDFKRSRRGTPEGFTRATTYAKTLLDTYGLNQWEKRMVAVGMAARPDLVRRAKGLDVTDDKTALEEIHEAAKEAAGGSEASSAGTEFHTVTEHLDAGLLTPETVPDEWRTMAKAYADKMAWAGLTTRTEWIERITFTDRGGEDVTGTADRILLERDGTPVIGDVKSGKGIDLAEREIAIQLLTYAMGVNQYGLYNKATKQWEPWTGPPVSEEYGIVMHVPVQRPNGRPAYCDLYRIGFKDVHGFDVARAMQAAGWVRQWRKVKGFAVPYSPPPLGQGFPLSSLEQNAPKPRQRTWAEAFSSVTTSEEANRLWEAAVEAGMRDVDLASNVALARRALQSHG